MQIIDDANEFLGDELRSDITVGSRVRIAAATFSILAFEVLKKELLRVEALGFIFTAQTFANSEATDKLRKECREFFIPQAKRESSLCGTDFEVRLRNRLTQRAIARECADWIRQSEVTFKSNSTGSPMQQFAISAAYMSLQGSTSAELGYERAVLIRTPHLTPIESAHLPDPSLPGSRGPSGSSREYPHVAFFGVGIGLAYRAQ